MDLKYKHFHQERNFAAPRDLVVAAARKYFAESLAWQITDDAEGFNAEGSRFAHKCNARVRFPSDATSTKMVVDLAVARASVGGFMLFDVGGYYNIQIRHWLDGTQANLHGNVSPQGITSSIPSPPSTGKGASCVFNGCIGFIVAMFLLYVIVTFFEAVVGLITGHLSLIGRGGTITVEGHWARITSAVILMFLLYLAWRIKKNRSFKKV